MAGCVLSQPLVTCVKVCSYSRLDKMNILSQKKMVFLQIFRDFCKKKTKIYIKMLNFPSKLQLFVIPYEFRYCPGKGELMASALKKESTNNHCLFRAPGRPECPKCSEELMASASKKESTNKLLHSLLLSEKASTRVAWVPEVLRGFLPQGGTSREISYN